MHDDGHGNHNVAAKRQHYNISVIGQQKSMDDEYFRVLGVLDNRCHRTTDISGYWVSLDKRRPKRGRRICSDTKCHWTTGVSIQRATRQGGTPATRASTPNRRPQTPYQRSLDLRPSFLNLRAYTAIPKHYPTNPKPHMDTQEI